MVVHSESEIMYLVSITHDILMMNAGFEAVWQRPASTFLGKKCYREIEKRSAPCPHCPGVIALRTGKVTEAEAYATLDDGTRIPFLLRAYPLYGLNGEPAGFVETAEDISGRRRFEDDARHEVSLVSDLLTTSSTSRVLTLGLDAVLRLEGVDSGCAYALDPVTGARELVAERGAMPAETAGAESAGSGADGDASATPQSPALVRMPVGHDGRPVAELVVRLSGDAQLWPSVRSKIEAMALMLASALARIREERLRGDALVNVQTILSAVPLAAFFLDGRGIVTLWNKAAELTFGWTAKDALGHALPIVPAGQEERFLALVAAAAETPKAPQFEFPCLGAEGTASDVWFRAAAIHDVLGDGSAYVVVAGEVARAGQAESGGSPATTATSPAVTGPSPAAETTGPADAQGLSHLFNAISKVLIAAQGPAGAAPSDDPRPAGAVAAGKMSLSWDESGAVDIHVCLPTLEGRASGEDRPSQALVIQRDQEDGGRLEEILETLGYSATVCTSVPSALEELRVSQDPAEAPRLAIVDMVMPGGPDGVETARLLTALAPGLRVVVSSDRGVVGHRAHGFAAALSRPYTDDKVRSAVTTALGFKAG